MGLNEIRKITFEISRPSRASVFLKIRYLVKFCLVFRAISMGILDGSLLITIRINIVNMCEIPLLIVNFHKRE